MPRPSPEDFEQFQEWLKQQGSQADPGSEDQRVAKEREGFSPEAWRNFAAEYENLIAAERPPLSSEVMNVGQRRAMLTRALSFFDWGLRIGQIPKDTKFGALFKFITDDAAQRFLPMKETFSQDDMTSFYVLKALVELKTEELSDEATIDEVISLLNDKYAAIKDIPG